MFPVTKAQNNRRVLISETHEPAASNFGHSPQARRVLFSIAIFCICSGLLLKAFHELWLPFQKEDGAALQIQLSSAIGSLLAALTVYLVMRLPLTNRAILFCETFLMAQLLVGYAFQSLGSNQAILLGNITVNAAQYLVIFLLFLTVRLFEHAGKRMKAFLWLLFLFRLFPSVDMIVLFAPSDTWDPCIGNIQIAISLVAMVATNAFLMIEVFCDLSRHGAAPNDVPTQSNISGATEDHNTNVDRDIRSAVGSLSSSFEDTLASLAKDRKLTMRERELLPHLVQGLNAKQISKQLSISEATAKTHIRNIYSKLDVHSRIEMIDLLNDDKTHR